MGIQQLKGCVFGAAVLFLLAGCNQMDTVLLSTGSYQVDALVGQFSLDEYSVVSAGDTILPYFVSPVGNDPDLEQLVLYVEDGDQVLGRRVSYSLGPALSQNRQPAQERDLAEDIEDGGEEEDPVEDGTDLFDPFPVKETTILVKDFTGKLPPFPLPEELEIGEYSLVFEIRGEYGLLSRTRRPFCYIGGQEFTVGEIRHYLPGFSGNRYLVSQGLTIMLEAPVDYGKELDPYIVWYSGKNKIGEGPAASGMTRLLWAAPLRSGFHSVRAEIFPFMPRTDQKGRIKGLSLPVSQKDEKKAGDRLYWYQFAGDLMDTATGAVLDPVDKRSPPPSWHPVDQVYGLGLQAGEIYETPDYSLDLSGEDPGEFVFFIRALSREDGRIFSASFGSSFSVGLSLEEGALILDLEAPGQTSRTSAIPEESGRNPVFTGALVTVSIEKTQVRAVLRLVDSADIADGVWLDTADEEDMPKEILPAEGAEILLAGRPTGKLRARIGRAAPDTPAAQRVPAAPKAPAAPDIPATLDSPATSTIPAAPDSLAAEPAMAEPPPWSGGGIPASLSSAPPAPPASLPSTPPPPVLVIDDFAALFRLVNRDVKPEETEAPVETIEPVETEEPPEKVEPLKAVEKTDEAEPEKTGEESPEAETAGTGDSEKAAAPNTKTTDVESVEVPENQERTASGLTPPIQSDGSRFEKRRVRGQ
jgi:hypothetical protein